MSTSFKTTDALDRFGADGKQMIRTTVFYAQSCATTGLQICSRFAELITMFSTVNNGKRNGMHERRALKTRLELLPKRQREVVEGLAKGLSYKEIAVILGIDARTVDTHVRTIQRKIPFSGRVGLLLYFYELRERDV